MVIPVGQDRRRRGISSLGGLRGGCWRHATLRRRGLGGGSRDLRSDFRRSRLGRGGRCLRCRRLFGGIWLARC